jgi:hypothetical protein
MNGVLSVPIRGTLHSAFRIPHSAFPRSRRERGQALVEYALIFPIQLLITLAIIQLAHIFIARQVLEYGAFCAARAALAGLSEADARQAAIIPISKIAGPTGVPEGTELELPGWETFGRTVAANEKTQLWVGPDSLDGRPVIRSEIEHMYELRVPIGDVVAYALGDVFLGAEDLDREAYGAPHIRMRASCVLSQPWGE